MRSPYAFLLIVLAGQLAGSSASAQTAPLDHTEILGRLAVGYHPSYIAHLVKMRGVKFASSEDFQRRVKLAGGDGILVERLMSADSDNQPQSLAEQDPPFDHLAKCAELIHSGSIEAAEAECRASIDENPKSPWPLLATLKSLQGEFPVEQSSADPDRLQAEADLIRRATILMSKNAQGRGAVNAAVTPPETVSAVLAENTSDPENLEQGELDDLRLALNAFPHVQGADPELLRRIRLEPDLATSHVALANQYLASGNFDQVHDEIQEALRLEPENPSVHIARASLDVYRGDLEQGIADAREAILIAPNSAAMHMVLAGFLEKAGRTPDAFAALKDFLVANPTSVETSKVLVSVYLDHNDRPSAIAELERSLQASSARYPETAKLVDARYQDESQLAELLQENHQLDAAAQQYQFLLRYKADDWALHNDYGNILLGQRKLDEAISEFTEAQRLNPEAATPHHNIGLCLSLKNQLDGAISEFERALDLNPNEPHSRTYLGFALGRKGESNAAQEEFAKVIEANPDDAGSYIDVGNALTELKDAAGAIRELKRALEIQPDSPLVENNLAWIYATADDPQSRNPAEALRLARSAVKNSPEPNAAFLDTLAEALLLNGQTTEAYATELRAAGVEPENPELRSRLSRFFDAAHQSPSVTH